MPSEPSASLPAQPTTRPSSAEVLFVFLYLGCTSFGGPIAHLGYFRKELVERRGWCSESTLAEIIALAQSLPGPASSQTGFALGMLRAGWLGGLAAWVGFTLASAILMLAFAFGHSFLGGKVGNGLLHGLQLVAVAVVAQAVLAMQRSLVPDPMRMTLAVVATALTLFLPPQIATIAPIVLGAIAGLVLLRSGNEAEPESVNLPLSKRAGAVSGAAFLLLLFALPILAHVFAAPALGIVSAFYQTGALVFGGGHVVLPLLESTVVGRGWVAQPSFLTGYGAAQALPGPLFAFAAYLGASIRPSTSPLLYGLLSLIGIFAPGLLLMAAVLPFWNALRGNRSLRFALKGINASVVGILVAALFHPLWTATILHASDFWIALAAFALLTAWKLQPWLVVASTAAVSILVSLAP